MPNTMKFFSKGVIFNQHFSVAEYTFLSLTTIEAGIYTHKSQVFNDAVNMPLPPEYKVLSEQMRDLGYYCVNVMGCPSLHYTGVGRGYDSQIINSYAQRVYEGVERTI